MVVCHEWVPLGGINRSAHIGYHTENKPNRHDFLFSVFGLSTFERLRGLQCSSPEAPALDLST
jgi:hypothetical protein